jgi:hypothetical protein
MKDQELWDLMGDLEGVGLGDKLTKAYRIIGFYEDGEEYLNPEIFTTAFVTDFIEKNKGDGVDCFYDSLTEPKSPHVDPLISAWFTFADKYLIISGDFTKVRETEERLRKEFVIEKEVELKDYKKLQNSGTSGFVGSVGATGMSGTSGCTGYTGGTSSTVYTSPGIGGSWSISGATVWSSKTASSSSSKMVSTSLKIEMEIKDLKDPPEDGVETYGHPLWEKIKGKLGF